MNKMPEEIKKGLECSDCRNCPYTDCYSYEECMVAMAADALAYIQQLEATNAKLLTRCERLERERDAAVNELIGTCFVCRWEETEKCASCHFNSDAWNVCESNWEWRGAKEE